MNEPLEKQGVLAWFASNHVAANLLMFAVLISGIMSMLWIKVEVFPEVEIDMIRISVPYLGATPSEVEEGVCIKVEEAIAAVEGIKRIHSVSAEGMGTIIAEVENYADEQIVLDDIKAQIDRIETFPRETEKPIITELSNRRKVVTIVVYGDASERTLKTIADRVRDDLTAMEGISVVEIVGVRRYEISIEISEETLRRYGLTFDQIARAVRNSSLDLPGGSVKTQGGEILVRTKGQKYVGSEFENIVVIARNDGTKIYLKDIATIIDGFEDSDIGARFNGKPAAMINVFRIGEQGAFEVAQKVNQYVDNFATRLPQGISVTTWSDDSRILQSRLDLLTRNACLGITLVFLCLTLFLDLKLAFWTTLGIPISFLGAFFLLSQVGISLNMISLFGFIMILGVVVDDAIVVGENIFENRQQGMGYLKAAIEGAKEMATPVTMAVLTTIAAFMPLLWVDGQMGKFIRQIPAVAICVLAISLIEAFFILPAHLAASKARPKVGPIGRGQKRIRTLLEKFIKGPFARMVERAVRTRYITVALAVAFLTVTIGYIAGDHIKIVFFDDIEADNMIASLNMPQGTSRRQTESIVKILEEAAFQVEKEFSQQENGKDVFRQMATFIGDQPFSRERGGPHGTGLTSSRGAHLAEVNIELVKGEERNVSSRAMADRWRQITGDISGVSSLTFTSSLMSLGSAIDVELTHHNNNTLIQATEDLKGILSQYQGVSEIADTFEPGKMEIKLDLKEKGRTLGLTIGDLAKQVRQGFYGEEVQRIQRGRDDIRVMLRYPQAQRQTVSDIESMRIRLANGTEVPFGLVAQVQQGRSYASVNRADRRRVVRVTADVDKEIATPAKINQELKVQTLPLLVAAHPGLDFGFEGEQRQRRESNTSMAKNFCIALLGIFGLLAVQFRSYVQPLIIMSAIPFGIIGAVIGHIIFGFNLGFLSMFGLVALTGVVVNDSLILVDLINRQRKNYNNLIDLIRDCSVRRFRPIILTTLTTFFGLMPMILEKSLQARFLIPMALSLAFGVLFATAITLILVPSLYAILEDIKAIFTPQKSALALLPENPEASPLQSSTHT